MIAEDAIKTRLAELQAGMVSMQSELGQVRQREAWLASNIERNAGAIAELAKLLEPPSNTEPAETN